MVEGQVQLRLKTRVAARPRQRLNSASSPSNADYVVVGLALFLLSFGFPNDWFRVRVSGETIDLGGGLLVQVVFLPLYFYLFARVSTNARLVVDAFRREKLLSIFLILIVMSALWSPETSATFRRAVGVSLTGAFAICVGVRFSTRQFLGTLATVLVPGSLLSLAFVFLVPRFGVDQGRWDGIFVNKNVLGRHEVMAFMVYMVAAGVFPKFRLRLFATGLLAAALVVGSQSATSLVALLLIAANLVVFRVFRARSTLFGAVVGSFVLTGIVSVGLAYTNLATLTSLLGKDVTFTGRTELWAGVMNSIAERPILGVGWDAYWRGWFSPSHEIWVDNPWLPPHSHNAFLDYLLTVGVVGCALIVGVFLRSIWRGAKFVQKQSDTASLFPLATILYSFVFSLSEAGVIGRHIRWVIFVVAVQTVADWKDSVESEPASDEQQVQAPEQDLAAIR